MEAVRVIEKIDLIKEDFRSYLEEPAAKELLDKLWVFIKMNSDGQVLYLNDDGDYLPGSPLADLIKYTVAKSRKKIARPRDIESFWKLLHANDIAVSKVERSNWTKL